MPPRQCVFMLPKLALLNLGLLLDRLVESRYDGSSQAAIQIIPDSGACSHEGQLKGDFTIDLAIPRNPGVQPMPPSNPGAYRADAGFQWPDTVVKGQPMLGVALRRLCSDTQSSTISYPPLCYRHQKAVLSSVQAFISASFSRGWKVETVHLIPPPHETTHSQIWQELSDQAFGASVLVRFGSIEQGLKALRELFGKLESVVSCGDPFMMVKFWRVCYYLLEIFAIVKDHQILYAFFRHFEQLMRQLGGPHPVVHLLQALSLMDRDSVQDSVSIGYLTSVLSIEDAAGTDNAVVLSMWANYIKHWDKQGLNLRTLQRRYIDLLKTADETHGPSSSESAQILHSFAYTAYYNIEDDSLSERLAMDLFRRTQHLPVVHGTYTWTIQTQAFAFAFKVLALLTLKRGHISMALRYLSYAITRVERGDRECQTRAIMLIEEQMSWQVCRSYPSAEKLLSRL